MTYHCRSKWTYADPIDDAPIVEIAEAIKHHGYSTPSVYGTFTVGDNLIINIGTLLNQTRGMILNQELFEEIIPEFQYGDNKQNAKKITVEVVIRVLKALDLFEKSLPIIFKKKK